MKILEQHHPHNQEEKLAIITSGGGMACVYSAGALLTLAEKFELDEPSLIISGSGSTGNSAYFLAKQYKEIETVWTKELVDGSEFISLMRAHQICDINHLVDVIFKERYPLDLERFNASKTKTFFAATNCRTGKAKYFDKTAADIFEVLRASMAIPGLYGEKVKIGEEAYIDGNVGATFIDDIRKAFSEGVEKILLIDNANNTLMTTFFTKIYANLVGDCLKKTVQRSLRIATSFSPPPLSNFFHLKFTGEHGTLDTNKERVKNTFEAGRKDVLENAELERFLKGM